MHSVGQDGIELLNVPKDMPARLAQKRDTIGESWFRVIYVVLTMQSCLVS